jgi:uncharacterized protein YukE
MSDIFLRHETINQAVEDMNTAASQMVTAVEDLTGQLATYMASFSGDAADQFGMIYRNRKQINDELTTTFSAGASSLGDMHQGMIDADRTAANHISG